MAEIKRWKLPFIRLALRTACLTCGAKPLQRCSHERNQVPGVIHVERLKPILQKFGEPIVCVLVFDDRSTLIEPPLETFLDVEEAYNYWLDATKEYPDDAPVGKLEELKSWIGRGNYGLYRVGMLSIVSVKYRLKGGIGVAV